MDRRPRNATQPTDSTDVAEDGGRRTEDGGRFLHALLPIFIATLCIFPSMSATESTSTVTFSASDAAAADVLGALVELSRMPQHIDTEFAGQAPRISLFLAQASPAGLRQAVAHAFGCWWAHAAEGPEIVYTRDAHLPAGRQSVRWATSGLIDQPALETLVTGLMTPWLGGDAGLSYQPDIGRWPATLDRAGHAQLTDLLTLLERATPRCPSRLPDPDEVDLEARIEAPLRSGTWSSLARAISKAGGISVALAPDLPANLGTQDIELPPGTLASVVSALERQGISARCVHGVLCLGRQPVGDREHPGTLRRLALVPIPQLIQRDVDGELIAAALERRVAPNAWARPGYALAYLPKAGGLLIAADAPTIHEVLDALDRLDRLGVDDGLASLDALAAPRTP
jgi:hypothetical protein